MLVAELPPTAADIAAGLTLFGRRKVQLNGIDIVNGVKSYVFWHIANREWRSVPGAQL